MADFQSNLDQLLSEGISVVAASVDPLDKAQEIAQKRSLTYPVGYGLDARSVSHSTGAFFNEDKGFLHATNFLLKKDKTIDVASYSSGPIGRMVAKDVLNLVKFYKGKK